MTEALIVSALAKGRANLQLGELFQSFLQGPHQQLPLLLPKPNQT